MFLFLCFAQPFPNPAAELDPVICISSHDKTRLRFLHSLQSIWPVGLFSLQIISGSNADLFGNRMCNMIC